MIVTVRFFARARDLAQCERVEVALEAGSSIAQLRQHLAQTVPALATLLSHSLLAVGDELAPESLILTDGASVALLPPVSGG